MIRWLSAASRDFLYVVRQLRRQPGHALTIILCLGIGLTVAVSAFSVVNALVFNDLPGLKDRTALLRVFVSYDSVFGTEGLGRGQSAAAASLSTSDFNVVDQHGPSLTGLAAEGAWNFTVALDRTVITTPGAFVSTHYFDVLGTSAVAGRLLVPADDDVRAAPAVVVGYDLWQSRFQARPDLVGQTALINGRAFAIVGIAPPLFTGIQPADIGQSPLELSQVWVPRHFAESWPGVPAPESPWLSVVGRLATGASRDHARAELDVAAARLSDARPTARGHAHIVTRSHGLSTADGVGFVLLVVALFMTLPLTVLAIGCANVANLQLARATERARELSVRLALGATRGQIVQLLSSEVLVLAVAGTILGWAGAKAILAAAAGLFPLPIPLDHRVFYFACGLVVGVTALSGIAPAWLATRRATVSGLNTAQSGAGAHSKLRSALVALQVALSLVLLFVAALSVRSLREQLGAVSAVSRELISAEISLKSIGGTSEDARILSDRLVTALRADSRVQGVAVADLSSALRYWQVKDDPAIRQYGTGGAVCTGWFSAVSAQLVAGRVIDESDAGAPVAVITQGLATELWPSGAAIGQRLRVQRSADAPVETVDVVGVIADPSTLGGAPSRSVYLSMRAGFPTAFTLIARARQPGPVVAEIRAVLSEAEPRLPWMRIDTQAERLSGGLMGLQYVLWLFGLLSALALGLASTGLYAVMGYAVTLRKRELAVRVALGANRGDLISLVLRQSIRLVFLGGVAGFTVAIPLAYAMRSQLVGVSSIDPLAVFPTLAVLLAVALTAGFVPARRAAAIDPLSALKEE